MPTSIALDKRKITEFCRRHSVRRMALFGSVVSGRFGPDSDVDVLVEFQVGHVPGLIGLAGMESELSKALGRKADLRTPEDLSRYFRDEVVAQAEVIYET